MRKRSGLRGWVEIFLVFTRLGCLGFGGPGAHLALFREDLVVRRGWLDDAAFARWLAVAQALPGPASSQLGMAIGALRGGAAGGCAAWLGFTWPSAALLGAALFWLRGALPAPVEGALQALMLGAVAVVLQALLGMLDRLCVGARARGLALLSAGVAIVCGGALGQLSALALSALGGWILLGAEPRRWRRLAPTSSGRGEAPAEQRRGPALSRSGLGAMVVWGLPLAAFPLASAFFGGPALALAEACWRAGALVFGGGHVVLPWLLEAATTGPGLQAGELIRGYALAQILPGPLFTYAVWVGGLWPGLPAWCGAPLALLAIFLPSAAMLAGVGRWLADRLRRAGESGPLQGVHAGVSGLLGAALWGLSVEVAATDLAAWAVVAGAWLALSRLAWPPHVLMLLLAAGGALQCVA